MKSHQVLLNQLQKNIDQIESQLSHVELNEAKENRFDEQLFVSKSYSHQSASDLLRSYFSEIQYTFLKLSQTLEQLEPIQQEKVNFLANKLVNQMTAINREIATQNIRKKVKEPSTKYESIHDQHVRYLGYQRRLFNMQKELELNLEKATSLKNQQVIQQQLATLEGRLSRCKKAITQLEYTMNK